jgi:hypothetical protein
MQLTRVVLLFAVTLAAPACEEPAGSTLLPSTSNPEAVVISAGFPSPLTAGVCPFNVTVRASSTVTLDRVTVELLDVSNLGAPLVRVPQTIVTSTPVLIPRGTTRVFTFQPWFSCAQAVGNVLNVRAVFFDEDGVTVVADTTARF